MPSDIYLFEPSSTSANSNDKPLVQILREAELARSQESARMVANAFRRLTGLFRAKKPAAVPAPRADDAAHTTEDSRLAA